MPKKSGAFEIKNDKNNQMYGLNNQQFIKNELQQSNAHEKQKKTYHELLARIDIAIEEAQSNMRLLHGVKQMSKKDLTNMASSKLENITTDQMYDLEELLKATNELL